jgi:hypothetical protein
VNSALEDACAALDRAWALLLCGPQSVDETQPARGSPDRAEGRNPRAPNIEHRVMTSVCATVLLFAALGDVPAGSCALVCELRSAVIELQSYDHGTVRAGRAAVGMPAHRAGGRWFVALESEPEQCWRGGFDRWTGNGVEAGQ